MNALDRHARPRRADLRAGSVPARRRGSRADRQGAPLRRARAGAARRASTIATRPSRSRISATCIRKACSAICIPKEDGGLGADFQTYCLAAAELGRYCGATALSWNMHVCSTLWSGRARRRSGDERRRSAPRTTPRRAHALPAHRRARRDLCAAVLGRRRGRRRRASRSAPRRSRSTAASWSTARRSSPRCRARPTTTASCAPSAPRAKQASRRNTLYLAVPAECAGRLRGRRLGPARHARHGLAHAAAQGRVRAGAARC